jgi:hypothetical protein
MGSYILSKEKIKGISKAEPWNNISNYLFKEN